MGLGGIGGGPNINNIQGASNQFESQKTGQSQTPAEKLSSSQKVSEELMNKPTADTKVAVQGKTEGVKQTLADGSGAPIPAGTDMSTLLFSATPGVVKDVANKLQESKQNPTLADAATLTTALTTLEAAKEK